MTEYGELDLPIPPAPDDPEGKPTEELEREVQEENSKDVRLIEKELVMDLIRQWQIKGVDKARDIQKLLRKQGIVRTQRSIYRYIKEIKETNVARIRKSGEIKKSVEELAFELRETYNEVTSELWKEYHRKEELIVKHTCRHCNKGSDISVRVPNSGSVRVQALRAIKEATRENVELMQSMGLVFKAADKVHNVNVDLPMSREELNQDFTAFIKAKYQDPTGGGEV